MRWLHVELYSNDYALARDLLHDAYACAGSPVQRDVSFENPIRVLVHDS
jgi:hypothetical protein